SRRSANSDEPPREPAPGDAAHAKPPPPAPTMVSFGPVLRCSHDVWQVSELTLQTALSPWQVTKAHGSAMQLPAQQARFGPQVILQHLSTTHVRLALSHFSHGFLQPNFSHP